MKSSHQRVEPDAVRAPHPLQPWIGPALLFLAAEGFVYRHLLAGELLDGRDLSRLDLPNATFLRDRLLHGELPFWIPYLHLGQPFLAVPETQALYPLRWLTLLLSPAAAVTLEHLLSLTILAVGTVWAARRLGARRGAATATAVAFCSGALMTSLSVEQNLVAALSWTGFAVVAGLALPRRPGPATVGLALSLALSWLAGAPEITVCQMGLAVGAALLSAPRERRLRAGALSVVAAGLGFCLAGPVTFPAFALGRRLAPLLPAEALQWSTSPLDLLSTIWPAVNLPPRDYYGEQHLVPLLFCGTLLTACAAFGLWRRHRFGWALGGAILLLALLSLGKTLPPAAWLLTHAPGLRSFRYPVKYLLVAEWLLALVAARGIDRIAALGQVLQKRGRFVAIGVLTLALLAGVGSLALPHLRAGAPAGLALALFFLALPLALLAWLPGIPSLRGVRFGRWLAALTVLEAIGVANRPQAAERSQVIADGSLVAALRAEGWARATIAEPLSPDELLDVSPALAKRVLSGPCLPFLHNRFVEQGLSSIDAEGPLDDSRLGAAWGLVSGSRSFRDLAGVSWNVTLPPPPEADLTVWASCADAPPEKRLSIYRSKTAMGRAFLVHAARPFVDANDAVGWLNDPTEPFRKAALVRERPMLQPCDGAEAVRVVSDRSNGLSFEVTACAPAALVINEASDPGWSATLDGAAASTMTADLFLQAVVVPQGTHQIVLTYEPPGFRLGLTAASASILALALAVRARRKKA